MPLIRIISGGQTGADQGALDAAIKLGIPHGGWIPKDWKTESGPLPDDYDLQEMSTASYPKRTRKNIQDADGTLIVSHGELTGGSELTKNYADELERPCIRIDLSELDNFQAAIRVSNWLRENNISILNVAGPRASEDPMIHDAVMHLVESVYHLGQVQQPKYDDPLEFPPRTVGEAIERLMNELPLKDSVQIANMAEVELDALNMRLGQYIRNNFRLWTGNDLLMDSCRLISGEKDLHPDTASQIIIDELWKKLRESHKLRVLK
jgi:hypothetical protein